MKYLFSVTFSLCLYSCSCMPWFQGAEEEIVKDLPVIVKASEALEESVSK